MTADTLRNAIRSLKKPAPPPETLVHTIPVTRILPNPSQPRRSFRDEKLISLAESIRRFGILQPLTVRPADGPAPGTAGPYYELIAGERRLRAARIAGLREVPCLIAPVDDRRSAEIALLENVQREDLNVFEQASAIAALIELYGLTQVEAAGLVGISQPALANKLRLLHLTPPERRLIVENELSERHARALLKLTDPDQRLVLLRETVQKSLNVRQLEAMIDRILCPPEPAEKPPVIRAGLRDLRIISNTIDRAVETIARAGLTVASETREGPDAVEYVIRVRRDPSRPASDRESGGDKSGKSRGLPAGEAS